MRGQNNYVLSNIRIIVLLLKLYFQPLLFPEIVSGVYLGGSLSELLSPQEKFALIVKFALRGKI